MKNKIKNLLRPIYAPVYNRYYDIFLAPKRYKYLSQSIRLTKAKNILEVGTWGGERALEMILEAQKFHKKEEVNYYGFDLFEQMDREMFKFEISKIPPTKQKVEEKLKVSGSPIHLFQGNTMQTLPEVSKTLPKMDFIYIDGGHSLETIQNDWDYTKNLMHKGTIVLFDDYWQNKIDGGAKPLIDSLDRNIYNVEVLPVVDVSTKSEFGRLEIQYAKVMLR